MSTADSQAEAQARRAARYDRQVARYARRAEATRRRISVLSGARLGGFLAAAAFGWAAFYDRLPWVYGPFAVVGLTVFLGAVYLHRAPHARLPRLDALLRLHRENAARLRGEWDALPDDGSRFLEPRMPHLAELQVFGKGSLFQLISRAALPAARERLATRLRDGLEAAQVPEVQDAVRELARATAFRARLHAEGRLVELDPAHLARFVAWAELQPLAEARFARRCGLLPYVLVPLTWTAIVLAAGFDVWSPWRFAIAIQLAVYGLTTRRLSRLYADLLSRDEARPFVALRRMFERVEARRFRAPALVRLRDALLTPRPLAGGQEPGGSTAPALDSGPPVSAGQRPSRRLSGLEAMTDSLAVRFNPLSAFVANALFLWECGWVGRLAAWRARHGQHVRQDLETLAEIEQLASLGGFAADHPDAAYPVLDPAAVPALSAKALGHPLIPVATRRCNDFDLAGPGHLVLVTGSNMAGKSSFLRTLGVNVILARLGGPVFARALVLRPCELSTSIQVTDSPGEGLSRFYAEVKRIRRILDECAAAEGEPGRLPRLFLIDEMLSGTNSRERNLASLSVCRRLLATTRSFGLVTTHDLSLVALESRFPGQVETCHFTDRFDGQALHFDYRLRPGVARTTNALDVLRLEGIEVAAMEEEP